MADKDANTVPLEVTLRWLQDWQSRLCAVLEQANGDTAHFQTERWQRAEGGGGESRLLEGGQVFEKAGVNYSHIQGATLPKIASAGRAELGGMPFQAAGVSLVIHPQNPYVPTCHSNLRVFSSNTPEGEPVWWFGGGYDLTPCYGFAEDCLHWHTTACDACAPFGGSVYPRFKRWCDEYFQLPHRNGEARGIGGLFFDDLNEWGFERCLAFIQSIGESFFEAYLPLVHRRKDTPYGERERSFQAHRRGRYAEFNLLWDRGTRFGLQSGGRTESILMSLPPSAHWRQQPATEADSSEARLGKEFLVPRNWLGTAEVSSATTRAS